MVESLSATLAPPSRPETACSSCRPTSGGDRPITRLAPAGAIQFTQVSVTAGKKQRQCHRHPAITVAIC
jgi:hypothetical protein